VTVLGSAHDDNAQFTGVFSSFFLHGSEKDLEVACMTAGDMAEESGR